MKRSFLLLSALTVLMFASCKRGDNPGLNTVTPGGYATLDDIFTRTAPPVTTQSIKVSSGGSVRSWGGTRVFIPRDAFISYSGALLTGSVDVKVYDWVRKGDMVFGKVLPVSNNEPLVTSGQLYIEITQNGVPVRLRSGAAYRIQAYFPQFNSPGAGGDNLYLGRAVAGSVNIVNWFGTSPNGSTTNIGDTTLLVSDSLRYIAASQPMAVSGYTNFTVRINTPVELEQSLAVAVYDNMRSVYPVASARNNTISAEHIPAGKLHFAVMGVNKGVFYAGMVPIPTPMTDSSYQVEVKQMDAQAFRLQLNAL